jgi:hypothetical protein
MLNAMDRVLVPLLMFALSYGLVVAWAYWA